MSDGALSQDEIDSLLAGLGDGGAPAAAPQATARPAPSGGAGSVEVQAFKTIIDATVGAQSQNLSMITGQTAEVSPPMVDCTNRDGFLRDQPEEVLTVSVPFAGSIAGDHSFVMSKGLAIKIASLANKDDSLSELDEMAISAVQECISTMAGSQITVISERTGNRNIQSGVAEGSFGPKAMARVPTGDFLRVQYQVQIGGHPAERIVEVISLPFVRDVLASMGGGMGAMSGFGASPSMAGQSHQAMGAQAPAQMGGFGGFGGMGQAGGMGAFGMGMPGMNPPNVQPVQFANLQVQHAAPESGNIGLIMDVFMEMTVELGRTRKLIKEILGMGEGTIIELDKLAGEPVDILVNHKLIAKGEVVVIDENFGVRVTEIVSPMERMADLG